MKNPKKNSFDLSDHLHQYEEEGFLSPIPLLSVEEASYYREKVEALEVLLGSEIRRFDFSHLFFDWAYQLSTNPRLLDYMETLIGPEIFLQSTRIFSKPAGDPAYVTWHQDGRHSSILNLKVAPTIWIALSPSTPESGCVQVVSGSHRMGKIPHSEKYMENNLLNEGDIAQVNIPKDKVRFMELQPGEMSIHNVNTLHGSQPNNAKDRRLGFSMTFINQLTKELKYPWIYARGTKSYPGHELLQSSPSYDLQTSKKKHQEFIRQIGVPQTRLVEA